MTISGNQLLSALGSGILPNGGSHADVKHAQAQSFDEILARVQRGEPSDIGIELGKGLMPESVSPEMRQQVGRAADLAAINGINRALIDLGDTIVRLDVPNRILEAQIKPAEGKVIDRIDGFVSMRHQQNPTQDPDSQIQSTQASQFVPARVVRNSSLAEVLSAHDPVHDS